MARLTALVFIVAVAVAVAEEALAAKAKSPKALRATMFAAARKEHSVHYVEIGAALGLRQRMVGDVAGTRGIQQVSFTLNGQKGRFTVLVVKRLAYLRANAVALSDFFGFTARQASLFHGRWISVPRSSRRYADIAASVTLPSFLQSIYPRAPLTFVKGAIGGRTRTGVSGTNLEPGVRFVEVVYPRSRAPLLPEVVSDVEPTRGFFDRMKIGRWNEGVRVQAPSNTVPISTVQAS